MATIKELRSSWLLMALALVLLLIIGLMASSAPAGAASNNGSVQASLPKSPFDTGCLMWTAGTAVDTPNGEVGGNGLTSVDVISASDIWAVGGSPFGALVIRWNGTEWVEMPNPGGLYGVLYDVAAVSANDVWIVGHRGSEMLVMHWDGSALSVISTPTLSNSFLRGVSAAASNDVWAVGGRTIYDPNEPPRSEAVALHWDGSTWSNTPTVGRLFRDVEIISTDDVWAVGDDIGHWNGATWTRVSDYSGLEAISAISATDIWAVGLGMTVHWDGTNWSHTFLPFTDPIVATLKEVVAFASDNVLAVGYKYDLSAIWEHQVLVMHWNGTDWQEIVGPSIGSSTAFQGMDTDSSTTAWAVGSYGIEGGSRTLVERWNGNQWTQVSSPSSVQGYNTIRSVDASASDNVWAVGYFGTTSTSSEPRPLTLHWNGETWRTIPGPYNTKFASVDVLSATDVWAVGTYGGTTERMATARWDGTRWNEVASPYVGPESNSLRGVSAVSTDDAWAVGYYTESGAQQALTLHWNGSDWTTVPSPNVGASSAINDVEAVTANDVWAVGVYRASSSSPEQSLILRWNGSVWNVVPSPNVGTERNILRAVAATSTSDIWAVGYYGAPGTGQALILHWDGAAWGIVQGPDIGGINFLHGVDAVSSDEAWAVGNYFSGGVPRTLTVRWDGRQWSIVPGENKGTGANYLYGVAATSPGQLMALGDYQQTDTAQLTLALNYAAAPPVFSDVPANNTFYPQISCLVCRGIISGYSDGTFRPNANVTRGQLTKIVANSAGFNEPVSGQTFEDVPPTNTFYEHIGRMVERGILGGYPCGGANEPCGSTNRPYFRPNANATRGQISKVVSGAKGYTDPVYSQTFEDVPFSHNFHMDIERLASRGIMGGYPCGGAGEPCGEGNLPYFRPGNNATRGQTSKIVSNAFFPNCQTSNKP